MKKYRKLLLGIALLWMLVIFLFSNQNADESGKISNTFVTEYIVKYYDGYNDMTSEEQQQFRETMDFIVRKGAHICEYFILCILNYMWLYAYGVLERFGKIKYIAMAVTLTVGYAVSDEFHQLFVPGRSGSVKDVLIDSMGSIIATLIILLVLYVAKRKNSIKYKTESS